MSGSTVRIGRALLISTVDGFPLIPLYFAVTVKSYVALRDPLNVRVFDVVLLVASNCPVPRLNAVPVYVTSVVLMESGNHVRIMFA